MEKENLFSKHLHSYLNCKIFSKHINRYRCALGQQSIMCHADDASRFATWYAVFECTATENALAVLEKAIKNHDKPASIMTDCGSHFYIHTSETKKEYDGLKRRIASVAWWNQFSHHSSAGLLRLFAQRIWQHKESGNTKIVVAPQVRLLQPAVIVERRKKYVLCV